MDSVHVFDFDDTLAHSNAMIYVHPFYNGLPVEIQRMPGLSKVKPSKIEHLPKSIRYSFSSYEYAALAKIVDESKTIKKFDGNVVPKDGHSVYLDFSGITNIDPESSKPIPRNIKYLVKAAADGYDCFILTGRGDADGTVAKEIRSFLIQHTGVSISTSRIICVGTWGGQSHTNKSKAFLTKILPSGHYDSVYFYDDDTRNLEEIKSTVSAFADVYARNSITDEVSSDAKDRVARARERRGSGSDLKRIRKLSGIEK